MTFHVFRTEKTFLMIRNESGVLKHIETQIIYSYADEIDPPDFDYGSKEENEAEQSRFTSGELLNLCLKVTAQALGETGTDYLGQVFVRANKAESELIQMATEHDMKNMACIELKNNILCAYNTLKAAIV